MRSIRVVVAGCWVVLVACGGVVERQVDETGGGRSSAGASNDSSRSGASGRAGSSHVAGSSSGVAGTAVTTPDPAVEAAACYNDTDCPGTACGDQVCNWNLSAPHPEGMKAFQCNPAGSQPRGMDGWCTTDDNCKCRWAGAKCVGVFCTFTRASDIPGG